MPSCAPPAPKACIVKVIACERLEAKMETEPISELNVMVSAVDPPLKARKFDPLRALVVKVESLRISPPPSAGPEKVTPSGA